MHEADVPFHQPGKGGFGTAVDILLKQFAVGQIGHSKNYMCGGTGWGQNNSQGAKDILDIIIQMYNNAPHRASPRTLTVKAGGRVESVETRSSAKAKLAESPQTEMHHEHQDA